jgi:hypothetical protein
MNGVGIKGWPDSAEDQRSKVTAVVHRTAIAVPMWRQPTAGFRHLSASTMVYWFHKPLTTRRLLVMRCSGIEQRGVVLNGVSSSKMET